VECAFYYYFLFRAFLAIRTNEYNPFSSLTN
jgi:hypothetical protein